MRYDAGMSTDDFLARFGAEAHFRLVPEALADIWRAQMGSAVEAVPDRDSWEAVRHALLDP